MCTLPLRALVFCLAILLQTHTPPSSSIRGGACNDNEDLEAPEELVTNKISPPELKLLLLASSLGVLGLASAYLTVGSCDMDDT